MVALLATLLLPGLCLSLATGHPAITENAHMVKRETPGPTLPTTLPEGYVPFPEDHSAYKIHEEDVKWEVARDRCVSEGAHLAIIESGDQIRHINSLKSKNWAFRWLHVGLHKSNATDDWIRVDNGLPVSSVLWAETLYLPAPHKKCAGIPLAHEGLVNYDCDTKLEYFVCEIKIVNPETPEPTSPNTLPEGYVPFPEDHSAYKIHEEDVKWEAARDRCVSEGAHLAIIESRDQIRHINSLKNEDWAFRWLHVGLHKSNATDDWIRVDNGLPVSPVLWAETLYSPAPHKKCVGIPLAHEGLVSYDCDTKLEYFVCEIKIVKPETPEPTLPTTLPEG